MGLMEDFTNCCAFRFGKHSWLTIMPFVPTLVQVSGSCTVMIAAVVLVVVVAPTWVYVYLCVRGQAFDYTLSKSL